MKADLWSVIRFFLLITLYYNYCNGTSSPTVADVNSVDDQHGHNESDDENIEVETSQAFVRQLFVKYGEADDVGGSDGDDDKDVGEYRMTFEGFEHLLESLGLGEVRIPDHGVDKHRDPDAMGRFRLLHGHNQHDRNDDHYHSEVTSSSSTEKRKRRSANNQLKSAVASDTNERLQQTVYNTLAKVNQISLVTRKCLTATEILRTFRIHHHRRHLDYVDHRMEEPEIDDRNNRREKQTSLYGDEIPDYISQSDFIAICPSIVYQLDERTCFRSIDGVPRRRMDANGASNPPSKTAVNVNTNLNFSAGFQDSNETSSSDNYDRLLFLGVEAKTWGIASLAIAIISLVGLLSVFIISLGGVGLNSRYYGYLVQFLIALAVGTLTGDALLHLLPHALVPHAEHSEDHDDGEHGDEDTTNTMVSRGLAVLAGVYGFLLIERLLMLISKYRQRKSENKRRLVAKSKKMEATVGQKLFSHTNNRLSVIVTTAADGGQDASNSLPDAEVKEPDDEVFNLLEPLNGNAAIEPTKEQALQWRTEVCADPETVGTPSSTLSRRQRQGQLQTTHETHGNHHHHGHSHDVDGVQSVAWMVIMGDGLHNFTDGLAIGAAFVAGGLGGGLGTTVAVFCHELPHELGDFAVLMNSGMSIRRALCYNIVSSVLSFMGMVVGLLVGNIASASSWIFSLTAGIFLYISLVDMIPQMSILEVNQVTSSEALSQADDERIETRPQATALSLECAYLVLHALGIALGLVIMTSIALYEGVIEQFSLQHFSDLTAAKDG